MQVLIVGTMAHSRNRSAGSIAPGRRFDLDDIGAPVRQQPHRSGPGARDRQIENYAA
jgi:hypothetical protein